MGSFWSDEKIEKSDDEDTVSAEIRLERYSKDLDFIINLLESDNPLIWSERTERSNLGEAILEKQKNIHSELLLFWNNDNRFSKFAKVMETQNQDDYQSGKYLAGGWFDWNEPKNLRLRIYDYELRINGDQMFIYKSKNWFRHKDGEWDPLPFFSEKFKWDMGDKCWFVFDKDVPYIEQEELWIDEDEFWNPIPDDNWNISIRSLDWVNFNQDEYNEALRIIEHFLSQF